MAEKLEFKTIDVEMEFDESQNKIFGHASIKNVMDYNGDVIVDGAYSDLQKTISEGFICRDHIHSNPLGMILSANEDEIGLYFEGQFHDIEDANDCLQVIKERLANGKKTTLSIGYKVIDSEMGQFAGRPCRYLKEIFVKEVSFTLLPANPYCEIDGTKSRNDEFKNLLLAVDSYINRLIEIKTLGRGKQWHDDRNYEVDLLEKSILRLKESLNEYDLHQDQDTDVKSEDLGTSTTLELARAKARAILEIN